MSRRAVVHVGEQLRRPGVDGRLVVAAHGDPEALRRAGSQGVAEARELELELAVVPRHVDRGGLAHELVVAQHGQADAEAAAVGLGDRDLDELGVVPGVEHPALDPAAVAEDLEHHLLVAQAGAHEQARGLAHRHRRCARRAAATAAPRRSRARAATIRSREAFAGGAEVVRGRVDEAIGAGRQAAQAHRGRAVLAVVSAALRRPRAPSGQRAITASGSTQVSQRGRWWSPGVRKRSSAPGATGTGSSAGSRARSGWSSSTSRHDPAPARGDAVEVAAMDRQLGVLAGAVGRPPASRFGPRPPRSRAGRRGSRSGSRRPRR